MKISELKRIGTSSMMRVITFLGEEILADEVTLARFHISEHADIDDEAFHAFCEAARFDAAKYRAVTALSYTAHTAKSLQRKLMQKGVKADAAEAAVAYVRRIGYIDDESYARRYAEQLFTSRRYGAIRVRQMLRQKGIDSELIEQVIAECAPDATAPIVEILRTKYEGADLQDYKQRQKVMAALARRGYTWEDIGAAMEKYNQEETW